MTQTRRARAVTRRDIGNTGLLSATEARAMFAAASTWLDRNAAAINAINVFPVPDGDTGSNMALTLAAAVAKAPAAPERVGELLSALAQGALMGARGNSGVILSQIVRGLAAGLRDADTLDSAKLARAIRVAAGMAREAVSHPAEGTILTTVADIATTAEAATQSGLPLAGMLAALVDAAHASVNRTPQFLPILREAGVVDAGALGLATILEGCLLYLQGKDPSAETPSPPPQPGHWSLSIDSPNRHINGLGYCTEFIVDGGDDAETMRKELERIGDSVILVDAGDLMRVHLHTQDPGAALSLGIRHGSLRNIKVENMQVQHDTIMATRQSKAGAISVVAVAAGAGLQLILGDYGATVVPGGQSMNPSTEEILKAIEHGSQHVIVLPNNKNILRTALQAAELSTKEVRVIPTVSVPQGIACLLAFRPEAGLEENLASMREAAERVRTAAITRASRSISIGGVETRAGQPIGLIDDMLTLAGESVQETALSLLDRMIKDRDSAVTIYRGNAPTEADSLALVAEIEHRWPSLEVQALAGGQPLYAYLISVE